MKELYYTISDEIFQRFPGYVRGVVIAHDVSNISSPEELIRLLRASEASVRERLVPDLLTEDSHIKSWREAYRSFGAKPSEFRSSIEAMLRRALRNDPLPTINALVDIGNVISLRHLVPVGGHAIDVVEDNIELRIANGGENFIPFGSDELEHPLAGEIIFAEGNTVLTRRWTWRQANHTLTLLGTRAIEFNVDGLPPVPAAQIEQACKEIVELVGQFCGGATRYEILSQNHPCLKLAA
jgi:DNA/RNA-binding domain of Phe-tRNA-synthetase-like protein